MKTRCLLHLVYVVIQTFLMITVRSTDVTEVEYYMKSVCGDGLVDLYSEECDGTEGCTEDCLCGDGYTVKATGGCESSCVFDANCLTGCTKPDYCEICNTTAGYTSDCQSCQDDYVWFGVGRCKSFKEETIDTCSDFFLRNSANPNFTISINAATFNGSIYINQPTLEEQHLSINKCTREVDQQKPYTYGYWFKLTSDSRRVIFIQVEKEYTQEDKEYAEFLQKAVGSEYVITVQKKCIEKQEATDAKCVSINQGTTKYVLSPQTVIQTEANVPYYMFVHTKFASSKMGDLKLFIREIKHVCSYASERLYWSDMSKGVSIDISEENSLVSVDVCSTDLTKGHWFRFTGADQTLNISTCNSKEDKLSLDLISINPEDYGYSLNDEPLDVDCVDFSKAKCELSKTEGCPNSILPKMIFTFSSKRWYFLFVGIHEESNVEVVLDFGLTCTDQCGEHGLCSSYLGACTCDEHYVLKHGTCSLCGNGQLDKGEECELSINGYNDTQCTSECNCVFGTAPMKIDNITKCALPTCGNGQIDENEECDGGFGCDHCLCVNGTQSYNKSRLYCLVATCGNKQVDGDEECDSGDFCVECECQEGHYYRHGEVSCRAISYYLSGGMFMAEIIGGHLVMAALLALWAFTAYSRLTKKIRQEIDDEKLVIFENTIIPFDKTNSQYIDLKMENGYFNFSKKAIDFGERRPEIDEPCEDEITLTNTWTENLHFTFHAGDYNKYSIMCKPFTGTIKPKESVVLTITFIARCTTVLNEKVPITLRYGKLQNIIKEIKKENPDLIAQTSQSSQNSEGEKSSSSVKRRVSNSETRPSTQTTTSSSKGRSSSKDKSSKSSSKNSSSRRKKSKVSKFHVYLNLQVESALSTKLDYEEIHLQHPPIGGGTFGIVYKAEWRKVDVAVKVMKSDLVDMMDLLPNFVQEAEMMERIRCPYIVNFIGCVITQDTLCLVTEFCQLGSLRKFMQTNPISDYLKVRFCQDVAKGMEYLHENDILHRDLKTDNILVYSKNPHDPTTTKISDFGTSRSFIESSSKIALQNIGTPVYMAPEISRKDQMTLKSDVFSFAICMLEIWIGRDVYPPDKFPDSESILRFVGGGKRLEIPQNCIFANLIEKSWQHKVSMRPSFKEISKALEILEKSLASSHKSDSDSSSKKRKSLKLSKTTSKNTETTTTSQQESEEPTPRITTEKGRLVSDENQDESERSTKNEKVEEQQDNKQPLPNELNKTDDVKSSDDSLQSKSSTKED
ncbi:serine-threonine protein kinase, putative [Entamoeba invadens IP1]|uniref:serine-threonine protein kinase, putative n=1 Tax=Entamoeba invadens IP1 TaxID=370355 RepID=UPI0002C3F1D1|nr:serine-threonine protein kinase, putative [Entamoeba invadens IP1]ELP90695.1 serine-threonine protein kinase, putative [Entamoeba invadens IP1]|eukprot:XP_004257466.1 serine-threonine protein kinase, putative [Entamoeba invadens IP1]